MSARERYKNIFGKIASLEEPIPWSGRRWIRFLKFGLGEAPQEMSCVPTS